MKIARLSLPMALLLTAGCIQLINPVANVTGAALVDTSVAVSTDAGSSQAASPDTAATGPTAVQTDTPAPTPVPTSAATQAPTPTPQIVIVMVTPTPTPTQTPLPPTPTPAPQESMEPINVTEKTAPMVATNVFGPFVLPPRKRSVRFSASSVSESAHALAYLILESPDMLEAIKTDHAPGTEIINRYSTFQFGPFAFVEPPVLYYSDGYVVQSRQSYYLYWKVPPASWSLSIQ